VTERRAAALAAAGCRSAWIGAESGSQPILDAMEKGIRVDQIASATERLRRRGIQVGFFLQFGYPGETREDIVHTLQMVRDCRPDDIGISVSYPLPGTRFYDRVKAELGEKQNWIDSDDLAVMFRATYGADFYRVLHAVVHAEFRARRGAAALRRPWPIDRGWARDVLMGAAHAARVPLLRRRLNRLGRTESPRPTIIQAVLSPQAAAVPSEQPR
jgi:radical SAM superfamily enzyme YgiQ (UPF0313 family)